MPSHQEGKKQVSAAAAVSGEIPIWIHGKELRLRVCGVDEETTVRDIMRILLGQHRRHYSMMEQWRQIQRPLSSDTKILERWQTWGGEQSEKAAAAAVKFCLKRQPSHLHSHPPTTQHYNNGNGRDKTEWLKSSRKIIETEAETNTGSSEASSSTIISLSTTLPSAAPVNRREVQKKIFLLKKIVKINKKLEKEEVNLVRLFISIENYKRSERRLLGDLRTDLDRVKCRSKAETLEFRANLHSLLKLDSIVHSKLKYLSELRSQSPSNYDVYLVHCDVSNSFADADKTHLSSTLNTLV